MKLHHLCLLTLIFASTAGAEDMYRGAWYAVPGASFVNTDSDLSADNSGGVFLRVGKEINPSWDIQFGASYANTAARNNISGRYKQSLFGVDALYFFRRDAWRPFLLVGAGVAENKLDYNLAFTGDNSRTSAMFNVGVGMQYLFSDRFGLQADVRQVWSRSSGQAAGLNASGQTGNTYLNLGAVFRFGQPSAPAPEMAAPVMVTPSPQPQVTTPEPPPAPFVAMEEPTAPPPPAVAEPAPPPPPAKIKKPLPPPAPVPMVTAPPAPKSCEPVFAPITIMVESLFDFDKATLRRDAVQALEGVLTTLRAHPEAEVVMIIGYTDRIGSDVYNKKLSQRRAKAVKAYLVKQGIEAVRLHEAGRGKADPIVTCEGVKGKKALIACLQPNRRVVISGHAKQQEKDCR